jgi:hypothetical protein
MRLGESNKPLNSIKNKLILKVSLLNSKPKKAELGMKAKAEVKHKQNHHQSIRNSHDQSKPNPRKPAKPHGSRTAYQINLCRQ